MALTPPPPKSVVDQLTKIAGGSRCEKLDGEGFWPMLFMARTLWASAASLDHLVGAQQERLGDREAERFGGC